MRMSPAAQRAGLFRFRSSSSVRGWAACVLTHETARESIAVPGYRPRAEMAGAAAASTIRVALAIEGKAGNAPFGVRDLRT